MSYGFSDSRVRIFMDFWNFSKNWRDLTKVLPEKNLDWSIFPAIIVEHLDQIAPLKRSSKELRAVKVYASSKPSDFCLDDDVTRGDVMDEHRRNIWLREYLDQLTSYTVDISTQLRRTVSCSVCNKDTGHYVEQGVDTKMAIDLVALASRDLYDIAVLITDDTDLIPSIQCVQDALDKQIIHVGFDNKKRNDVKNEAWGHLFIDDMLSDIAN
jgi:uncharacterized LabA/DUF88 family protein